MMSKEILIKERIRQSIDTKQFILLDELLLQKIQKSAEVCITAFRKGSKVLFCGNGGSAADAQHLAAEFSGRYLFDRDPLPSEALHVNTSYMTAVANDYSYDEVYSRMIRAVGKAGDILFAITTSGNSPNILKAAEQARSQGLTVIGLTGDSGGLLSEKCDILLNVPSGETPRIQESHILLGHIICEIVESSLFPRK